MVSVYMIFLRNVKEEFFQHLIHNPSGFFLAHPCFQMFSQIHVGNIIIDRIIFFRVLCRLFIVVIMILLIHQRQDRRCIVVILIIFIQLFCVISKTVIHIIIQRIIVHTFDHYFMGIALHLIGNIVFLIIKKADRKQGIDCLRIGNIIIIQSGNTLR